VEVAEHPAQALTVPPAALAHLRRRLAGEADVLPFAEAVLRQLASGAGALAGAPTAQSEALAERLAALLLAVRGEGDEALVPLLLAEPALASALFQNLDLLYAHPWRGADAVSLLLARLVESEPDGG
jgi:hypothetical protein